MVASQKVPDWLPPGFTQKLRVKNGRKVKYYCNVATGEEFYSKKDVIGCARMEKISPQVTSNEDNKSPNDEICLRPVKESDSTAWLPSGWVTDVRIRKSNVGSPYKVYVNPSTGKKFYSKQQVVQYLRTMEQGRTIKEEIKHDSVGESSLIQDVSQQKFLTDSGCTPKENKEGNDKHSENMVGAQSTSLDGLPPGWIKEIKTNKSGNKKRTYTDRSEHNDLGESALGQIFSEHGCATEENKVGYKRLSLDTVASGTLVNGLPPGWKKEVKRRKSENGIRNYTFYTDTVSGYAFYSKMDVLRYLETNDIHSCVVRPKKQQEDDQELIKNELPHENACESSLNQDVSQECKLMVSSGFTPQGGKEHEEVATQNALEDGLPQGWIKEVKTSIFGSKIRKDPYYTDPVSGYVFRSKKDVFRYLKTGNIRSCRTRPRKRELDNIVSTIEIPHENMDKSPVKLVASEECKLVTSSGYISEGTKEGYDKDSLKMVDSQSPSVDGLPPGWKIVMKKEGSRNRKIYIHLSSGSKFYSKPAVARYLKSIENGCATTKQIESSSTVNEKQPETLETKSELSSCLKSNDGDASLVTKNFASPEAKSKEHLGNNFSDNSVFTYDNTTKSAAPENGPRATKEGFGKDVTLMTEDATISSPVNSPSTEQKPPESVVEKWTRKTQPGLRKSKKKVSLDLPRRTSERLSGRKIDMLPNTILGTPAEGRKPADTEADKSSSSQNVVADGVPQPAKEVLDHVSVGKGTLQQEVEPSKERKTPITEDQPIPEVQTQENATVNHENENLRSEDPQLFYPFGESWSDPCLEFAFKTLTGAIPVDDTLAFSGCFTQQVDIPCNLTDVNLRLTDVPTILQNEVPTLPQSVQQQQPVEQSVPDPLLPRHGNVNFPCSSGINPPLEQQSTIEQLPPGPLFPAPRNIGFSSYSGIHPFQHRAVEQLPPDPLFLSPGNINVPSSSGIRPQPHGINAGDKDYHTR